MVFSIATVYKAYNHVADTLLKCSATLRRCNNVLYMRGVPEGEAMDAA